MTDWEDFWDEEKERYRFEDMTWSQIMSLADGYDDRRIDHALMALHKLLHPKP